MWIVSFVVYVYPDQIGLVPFIRRINPLILNIFLAAGISWDKIVQIGIDIIGDPVVEGAFCLIEFDVMSQFPLVRKEIVDKASFG